MECKLIPFGGIVLKDLSRNVSLFCDICGNDQFIALDGETHSTDDVPETNRFQCSDCGKIFTKAELLEVNQEVINANIDEVKAEAIREFEKELAKALNKLR